MPITPTDLERFYEFALARVRAGEVVGSLEECVIRWRQEEGGGAIGVESQPFEKGMTLADRLKASGVLGASTTGPVDLSTNPDYMRGFAEP